MKELCYLDLKFPIVFQFSEQTVRVCQSRHFEFGIVARMRFIYICWELANDSFFFFHLIIINVESLADIIFNKLKHNPIHFVTN